MSASHSSAPGTDRKPQETDALLPKKDSRQLEEAVASSDKSATTVSKPSLSKEISNSSYGRRPLSIETRKEDNDDEEEKEASSALVTSFMLMIVFQLGNRLFGKLETYPMHNYPLFLNVASTILYLPLCFVYIIPAMLFTNNISKEALEIPQHKFAIMGALDSIAGIMQTFSINFISNASMIVLVQQSAIPISMAVSRLFLQARYSTAQYTGAGIVLLGIVAVLIPNFIGSGASGADSSSGELVWYLVMILSCIPSVLSSVYKEKALGEVEVDIIYLNGMVAVYQTLFALPLCLPSAGLINIPISEIPTNLFHGLLCWGGENSITDNSYAHSGPDNCSTAPWFVSLYFFFNIGYNMLTILILKHGSANILWLASTIIVPLSNVAFSLQIVPGHQPMKFMDFVGLVIIMLGLCTYRFTAQVFAWIQGYRDARKASKSGTSWRSTFEEEETARKARRITRETERQQLKFMGINFGSTLEALNTLFDSRVTQAQRQQLFRSPQQIRGSFLVRLGIPPSPLISMEPQRGRSRSSNPSPAGGQQGPAGPRGSAGVGVGAGTSPRFSPALVGGPASRIGRFGNGPDMQRRFSEAEAKIGLGGRANLV
jgi:uncharacterized membrane protein